MTPLTFSFVKYQEPMLSLCPPGVSQQISTQTTASCPCSDLSLTRHLIAVAQVSDVAYATKTM
jgi:hypothetical protein